MVKNEFDLPCIACENDFLFIRAFEGRHSVTTIDIGVCEDNEVTRIALNEESLKVLIERLQEVYNEVYGK